MQRFCVSLLLILISFNACKKTDPLQPDCEQLYNALKTSNESVAATEINLLIEKVQSRVSKDKIWSIEVLTLLVEELNHCENIQAAFICFECIETLPVQSEIEISIQDNGATVTKTLDLARTPNNFVSVNIHD